MVVVVAVLLAVEMRLQVLIQALEVLVKLTVLFLSTEAQRMHSVEPPDLHFRALLT